ncbi:hypothetical protein KCU74_g2203, partial [Aureobasidium melanogenum]
MKSPTSCCLAVPLVFQVSYPTNIILATHHNKSHSRFLQSSNIWSGYRAATSRIRFSSHPIAPWKRGTMQLKERETPRLSQLVPYSSLVLTISCVVIFLARIYILEPLVKRYNEQYKCLSPAQQRSLINHYVAATTKLLLLFVAAYPSIIIITGRRNLHSRFGNGNVEYGDVLLCVFEVFTSMYIFELFYREKVSYISAAHHIGAVIITQTAIVLFEDPKQMPDAELEFLLCLIWGFFDIAAELWPHLFIIIYCTWPENHAILADIFLATTILELIGTITETATIFTMFFLWWEQWTIDFRVLTPTLHLLFSCAQLWGARVFWLMSRQHRRAAKGCMIEDNASEALSSPSDYRVEIATKQHSTRHF